MAGHNGFPLLQLIAAAKKRGQEKAKLTKSLIVLDVKPWDDTTGDQQTCQGWAAVHTSSPAQSLHHLKTHSLCCSCLPLQQGLCSSARQIRSLCTTPRCNRVCCSCKPLPLGLLNVCPPPQDRIPACYKRLSLHHGEMAAC